MKYTEPSNLIREFVTRGLVVLSPTALGIPNIVHQTIYEKEKAAFSNKELIDAELIPEILDVLSAPGLVEACDQIIGEDWAIVPYTHNTPFVSGSHDQHWHKDDNGPFNARRVRYHHAIQIEMLYYPQAVGPLMGPTATIPYSQYWTFNHEENHDNFAGADHLDFQYQINGMERVAVSGPRSQYPQKDILDQKTDHDIRLRSAVETTGWPLVEPFEVSPLEAGSVVLYSHNLFHRGNHRRDEFSNWKANPRFMWRFWLYRTKQQSKREKKFSLSIESQDSLTNQNLSKAEAELRPVWEHHYHWLNDGMHVVDQSASSEESNDLEKSLNLMGDSEEPKRIGAAYRLASNPNRNENLAILERGLFNDRESVRRASTYGLVAIGSAASDVFLRAAQSTQKWARKSGAFGLGEVGELSETVISVLGKLLLSDSSVYIRSVAASALGSFGRRLAVPGCDQALVRKAIDALLSSLATEENRLSMDRAQGRDIKFVRPTDECDICEGIGINYGHERFSKVRSIVRENSLWSLVVICGQDVFDFNDLHEPLSQVLENIIINDQNIFSVGLAVDAWNRLITIHGDIGSKEMKRLTLLLKQLPIRPWDSLCRGGYPMPDIQVFNN